jgi:hypothetical protein
MAPDHTPDSVSGEEAAVGRHTAPDGETVHPVVAAALARRAVDGAGAHRDEAMERFATQRIDGNVGWPGEPPAPGGGLGWPGDLAQDGTDRSEGGDVEEGLEDDVPDHPEAPAGRRRGWRRLLGLDSAA